MSRPKYWWYDYVKKSIMHSVGGKAPATLQESMSDIAVGNGWRCTEAPTPQQKAQRWCSEAVKEPLYYKKYPCIEYI